MDLVWVLKIFWEPFFWAYGPLPARARGVEEAVRAAAAARLRPSGFFHFNFFSFFSTCSATTQKNRKLESWNPRVANKIKEHEGWGELLRSGTTFLRNHNICLTYTPAHADVYNTCLTYTPAHAWCSQHLSKMHAFSPQKCAWTRACAPMQRFRSCFAMEAIAKLPWVLHEHRAGCLSQLPPALAAFPAVWTKPVAAAKAVAEEIRPNPR